MHVFVQLALVFFTCLLGQLLSLFSPFPMPSSVAAMVLLFLLFATKLVKTDQLQGASNLLLKNLSLLLLPSGVSILGSIDLVKNILLPFFLICASGTIVTFLFTALITGGVIRLQARLKQRGAN